MKPSWDKLIRSLPTRMYMSIGHDDRPRTVVRVMSVETGSLLIGISDATQEGALKRMWEATKEWRSE